MKKYVKNRWSSFQECLERVLELTLGLKQYFEVNGTPKQREYFKEDGPNIAMLQLLLCLVNKLNHYIITFQEENMDIQKVVRKLKQCALGVGEFLFNILDTQDQKGEKFEEESFVDSDYMFDKLRPLIAKDITKDSDSYKNSSRSEVQFQSFFLDAYPHLKVFLENKDSQFCNNFFKVAHEFLETAFERIKKEFPFTDSDSCLMCVDGFLLRNKSSLETLKTLAARFDNVIPKEHFSKFNEEVNDLVHEGKRIGKKVNDTLTSSFLSVWKQERDSFGMIYKLALAMQVLPFSTVSLERSFSVLTDIKTIKRNRLCVKNLQACLLIKQDFKDGEITINEEMLSAYTGASQKLKGQLNGFISKGSGNQDYHKEGFIDNNKAFNQFASKDEFENPFGSLVEDEKVIMRYFFNNLIG